ncbi:MAG: sugar ABC transporter substrate-binding protein [Hyphomicrobiaceae bacterium]|nr:sugar ABC transporter substrate-binding protein [Hyphomicrobiaceae bacterium]
MGPHMGPHMGPRTGPRMGPRLAVFTKNLINPAYAAARLGAERVARRFAGAVEHYVPDIPDDVPQQIALIDRAILSRPDAAVLTPVHQTRVNDAILRLNAARIPMFTFVTPVTAGEPITFVGSDDTSIGKAIARRLFESLGGKGRIVILEGSPASETSRHRLTGFKATLAEFPSIELAGSLAGDYQRGVARAAFQKFISASPIPEGVLCANDVMALGTIDALTAQGQAAPPPTIVGVNAIPEAIDAIIAGRMLATADFNAMAMCAVATEAAFRHLRGETVPAQISLPALIVDRTNASQWALPYDARELPVWGRVA